MSATRPQRIGLPRPAQVQARRTGMPQVVDGVVVEAMRESWLVEDRWWTPAPVRRRYWEVVTVTGQNIVVFSDLIAGGWYRQAALLWAGRLCA